MSVQHRNLAEIWTTLEGRHDIANILREIIGQHSIDSTLQGDESGSAASCIQKIIWIKTIFDLQRCYLSGLQGGVAECPPYVSSCLLPSELLLSTLLYLVNVKTRLFPSQTTLMTREFIRPRHILAQTILSGLRLVLLRKETVAAHDTRRLQSAINAAWQNDRLHGVERFIVLELYAEVLNFVSQESRENDHGNPYITEWSNARLPTFAAGLVSFYAKCYGRTLKLSSIHWTSGRKCLCNLLFMEQWKRIGLMLTGYCLTAFGQLSVQSPSGMLTFVGRLAYSAPIRLAQAQMRPWSCYISPEPISSSQFSMSQAL